MPPSAPAHGAALTGGPKLARLARTMRPALLPLLLLLAACSRPSSDAAPDAGRADPQCPGGRVQGCLQAAYTAERTGDSAQAAAMYRRACDGGEAGACNRLGAMAWAGRGMPANPEEAYALYVRACEGGDGAGCFSAAICHRTGTCAPKDEAKQQALLARGCALKDARACAEAKR